MENVVELRKITSSVNFKYNFGNVNVDGYNLHSDFELFLFLGGNTEFLADGVAKTLTPFDIVIIPPLTRHQFRLKDDGKNYERSVFTFYQKHIPQELLRFYSELKILNIKECPEIIDAFTRAKKYCSSKYREYSDYLINSVFLEVVSEISFLKPCNNYDDSVQYSVLTDGVLKYVEENFAKKITVSSIAKEFFVSPSTLAHTFKREFGESIMKFVNEQRLIRAHHLMVFGEKHTRVYDKVGFSDYPTFYKAYKSFFGETPAGKRKN